MTRLPEEECAFYYAAMATLELEQRVIFVDHVANTLDAFSPFCEPGEGDIDRAVRAAFAATWIPPLDTERGRCRAGIAMARGSRKSRRWRSRSRRSGHGGRWRDTATCRPNPGPF
jgi:hypothetical protein